MAGTVAHGRQQCAVRRVALRFICVGVPRTAMAGPIAWLKAHPGVPVPLRHGYDPRLLFRAPESVHNGTPTVLGRIPYGAQSLYRFWSIAEKRVQISNRV